MRSARLAQVLRGSLGAQAGWIVGPYAAQQAVRLATNILLARMLAPEMFGIMLIVNTLRTGLELLSDVGIGQSVVRSPHAEDRRFLDTAWTLQLLRGIALALLTVLAAALFGGGLGHDLPIILCVASATFVLTGLQSPGLYLNQRAIGLRQRAAYDLGCTLFQCSATLALAALMPSVWALVWGLLLATAFSTMSSYAFRPWCWPRLAWDRAYVREIFGFGKWIFLATAIYFASISADKMAFAAVLPVALVGVYSVARTFADMVGQLAQRAGSFLVFPKVAMARENNTDHVERMKRLRLTVVALLAAVMAFGVAVSDAFVLALYDPRYSAAAFMLPILMVGAWFAALSALAEATLMGCGRPANSASGNGLKFAVLVAGLPAALVWDSLLWALIVLVVAEAARWLLLCRSLQRDGYASFPAELMVSLAMVGSALAIKAAAGFVGLVPSIAQWWALGQFAHG